MIPRHLMIGVGVLLVAVLGVGIYAGRMRGRAAQVAPAAADTRPVAPPVSGPTERVTLYVAHDDSGTLRTQAASNAPRKCSALCWKSIYQRTRRTRWPLERMYTQSTW